MLSFIAGIGDQCGSTYAGRSLAEVHLIELLTALEWAPVRAGFRLSAVLVGMLISATGSGERRNTGTSWRGDLVISRLHWRPLSSGVRRESASPKLRKRKEGNL